MKTRHSGEGHLIRDRFQRDAGSTFTRCSGTLTRFGYKAVATNQKSADWKMSPDSTLGTAVQLSSLHLAGLGGIVRQTSRGD